MADRYRSQDGHRETEDFISKEETPDQQGRFGGNLQRKVGTRDALKRVEQGDDATTRVRKSDEAEGDA